MPEPDEKASEPDARVLRDDETESISGGISDDPPNPVTDPNDGVPPPPQPGG